MSGLSAFLPRTLGGLVGPALGGGESFGRLRGAALFCDVAGFTPLTEALSVLGKEGAEELTRLLNGYFARMIGIIEEEGGDVLRFGGDAMTVLFPGETAEPALRAAHRMMGAMGEFASLETRAGSFGISMKIGAAFGEVLVGVLHDGAGTYEFYGTGSPLDDSAAAEHHARPGLIICHPSASQACGPEIPLKPHREGYRRLSGPVPGPPAPLSGFPHASPEELSRLVPPYLAQHAGAGAMGEHRGTAVLFASFSGIEPPRAAGAGAGDDLRVHRELGRAFAVFISVAKRYGGVVNKLDMGDKGAKALLLFGSPYALENKEEMAARAALDLLASGDWPEGLELRVGLTSAPLFTGPVGSPSRREFTVMGDGINLAARLMQAAAPGRILCDGRVASEAGTALRFGELPPMAVKGKREPVTPFVPLGEREEGAGPTGDLVERDALCRSLREFLMGGEGPPLALVAEAGLGKTALAEWARAEVRRRGGQASLVTLGPFSQERPLAAWQPHLRYLLGLRKGDTADLAREALARALAPEPAEYRPLLNPLLDLPDEGGEALRNLSPKERKDLTFAILGRVFSRGGPRALLVDNLQWADPLSLEFLGFLQEDPEPQPWRLVVTLRPGTPEAETSASAMRREELPLTAPGVEAYLRKRHGFAEMEKGVLDWFVARFKGNPAVAAALVVALEGAGLVARDAYGARVDPDRLFQTTFPDTLEGLYLARVEGLPARSRTLLQQASVLGAAVSGNLLVHLTGLEGEELAGALAPLTSGGILLEDSWGTRPYYRFADGLLRDAVYESVPFALKREAHQRVAEFLQPGADRNPRLWPTLAHHFERAGDDLRARTYHRLAGRDAAARSDNVTALKHLEFVCRDLSVQTDDIEDAYRLMDVCAFLGRRDETRAILDRLESFRETMGPSHLGRLHYFLAREAFHAHSWCEVESRLLEGMRFYEDAGDTTGVGKTLVNLVGLVYGPTGKLDQAKECLERALALPEGPDQAVFRTMAAMNLGAVYKHMGSPTIATSWFKKAHAKATNAKLGPQKGIIEDNLCAIHADSGEFARASQWGRRAVLTLDTFAVRGVGLMARYNLSLAYLSSGMTGKVHTLLERVYRQAVLSENYQVQGMTTQGLSQAALQETDILACLNNASKALKQFRNSNNGRDFRFTLLCPGSLFFSLDAASEASDFWEKEQVEVFLKETPPDSIADVGLARLRNWMRGKNDPQNAPKVFLGQGLISSPEERLERFFWLADFFLTMGDSAKTGRFLNKAETALEQWPHFDARVRFLAIHGLYKKFSRQREKVAHRLIRSSPGGVWGLRLLCLLVQGERRSQERAKLLRIAKKRLAFCRDHSPGWAWTRVASFPEVAAVLKECDGDKGSRKRGVGSRKKKTAPPQKRA